MDVKYKRILLKLSGEALAGNTNRTFDYARIEAYMNDIKEAWLAGVHIGLVVGGGNIFRGLPGTGKGVDRIRGDYMGMLSTVINGLAMQSVLENMGVGCRILSAIGMEPAAEKYSREKVEEAFAEKKVVIFVAGTGNPFFTTDTAAALRAVEMKADLLLKATRVDGVYSDDPEKKPDAVKFDRITFTEAYSKGLAVMDLTAYTLCRENHLPLVVFNINNQGNLLRIIKGESIGTLVVPE
ncbi:MAG TPA: UMP kinase [Bacteroidales bacterium]|nr:UMP kinase [Bacteroidales bacterium]